MSLREFRCRDRHHVRCARYPSLLYFLCERHADVIYVIERGRVVEQGTHKELVERAGHYARLYSHQAEGAVVTPIGS